MKVLLVLSAIAGAATIYQKSFILGLLTLTLFSLLAMAVVNHRLLKSGMMLAASVLASWAALEGALLLLKQPLTAEVAFLDPSTDKPLSFWQANDAYGVLPSEGVYKARKVAMSGEVIYDVIYTVDADGFRHMPEPGAADAGSVYFLGGSATFGEGLNDDQTLPRHFSLLASNWKVRNKAISGWGLHQAYTLWKNEIEEPGATIIVQTAPWHADRAACIPQFSGLSPRYEIVDDDLVRNGRCRTWFDNKILSSLMMKSGLLQRLYDLSNRQHQKHKIRLYIKMLVEMNHLAKDREQCFIVAFNKAEEIYLNGSEYTNKNIAETLGDIKINVVDTTLSSKKEDLDSRYYIVGDGHPSNDANQAKAQLLSAAIKQCEGKLLALKADQ